MRAKERRHLKQNEFVETTAKVMSYAQEQRRPLTLGITVFVLVVAIGGSYFWYRRYVNDQAGGLLGIATSMAQAPIVPPPSVPGATQAAGTYPTEQARTAAAQTAYQDVIAKYPASPAARTAHYQLGVMQLQAGNAAQAEQTFQQVASDAGATSMYGLMARLGHAQALVEQKKYDDAIKEYTDLSGQRDSSLPIDGVLMQLARTCQKAGKTQDARAAFKRVVDEFPDSPYAADAKQQITPAS
jgi:TolA-binding protein